jgi:hypothetical protein
MAEIAGEALIKSGVANSGWERDEHIQHTSDAMMNQVFRFQRQLPQTFSALENEDLEVVVRSLEMYERDRDNLKFNIQNDKVERRLFKPVLEYIKAINNVIAAIREFLEP